MHRKWIQKQIQIEKTRLIQMALAQPLLNPEYNNSFNAMPVTNNNSIYMGEPIITGQNVPQNAPQNVPQNVPHYNPTLPTYQARTHWFVKFLDY